MLVVVAFYVQTCCDFGLEIVSIHRLLFTEFTCVYVQF